MVMNANGKEKRKGYDMKKPANRLVFLFSEQFQLNTGCFRLGRFLSVEKLNIPELFVSYS